MAEYRIVKKYNSFFSHWHYELQKKVNWSFLWWKGFYWNYAAGNSLTKYIPNDWDDLNIVEQITEEI